MTDAGTPIILYGRLYTKYQFAISEVDTFAFPRNGAVYSQGNEVIVPASGETAEDIARASAVEKSGVLLGGDLNILRPFDFINPLFLALAISNGEPQKELAKKAQGKSVVHIHNTDIQEVTIAYPSRTEQDRIVSVFRQLDNLITLHQRQPFLHSTPDISLSVRLIHPFYTSSWEQRKFGEITSKYEDPVPTPHDGYYRLGIRSHAKGTFHSYVAKGQELETAQMHRVAAGNFIVNITFGWEHAVAITDKNDAGKLVSHRFPQFSFAEGMVPEFFRYVIVDEKFRHHLWLASPGGAGRNRVLKLDEMLNYLMRFPSRDEQIKIAEFFHHLDNLITLHQRKGKAAVSGCFLNCFSLEKSSAQSRTLELFGQISNQEIKYIIDGLSILGGKLRNFCVKLIILLGYTRINDIAKYHISRNTKCVHNVN